MILLRGEAEDKPDMWDQVLIFLSQSYLTSHHLKERERERGDIKEFTFAMWRSSTSKIKIWNISFYQFMNPLFGIFPRYNSSNFCVEEREAALQEMFYQKVIFLPLAKYLRVAKIDEKCNDNFADSWSLKSGPILKTRCKVLPFKSGALPRRGFLKGQSSFLWSIHLNQAVSVCEKTKNQKSDFYLKKLTESALLLHPVNLFYHSLAIVWKQYFYIALREVHSYTL